MKSIEQRFEELGLALPAAPQRGGNYAPWRIHGDVLYLAGVIAIREGAMTHVGQVGAAHTIETGYAAAQGLLRRIEALEPSLRASGPPPLWAMPQFYAFCPMVKTCRRRWRKPTAPMPPRADGSATSGSNGNSPHGWLDVLPETFSVLQSSEALVVHLSWIDRYKNLYDPATHARIVRARSWTSIQIDRARETRDAFHAWLAARFGEHPCIALPSVPCPAVGKSALDEAFRAALLRLTSPASISGAPALCLPIPFGHRLSLGWQVLFRDVDIPAMRAVLNDR